MNLENVLYEKRAAIAYVTLNRPKLPNALNMSTRSDLAAAFREAHDEAEGARCDPERRGRPRLHRRFRPVYATKDRREGTAAFFAIVLPNSKEGNHER